MQNEMRKKKYIIEHYTIIRQYKFHLLHKILWNKRVANNIIIVLYDFDHDLKQKQACS